MSFCFPDSAADGVQRALATACIGEERSFELRIESEQASTESRVRC